MFWPEVNVFYFLSNTLCFLNLYLFRECFSLVLFQLFSLQLYAAVCTSLRKNKNITYFMSKILYLLQQLILGPTWSYKVDTYCVHFHIVFIYFAYVVSHLTRSCDRAHQSMHCYVQQSHNPTMLRVGGQMSYCSISVCKSYKYRESSLLHHPLIN